MALTDEAGQNTSIEQSVHQHLSAKLKNAHRTAESPVSVAKALHGRQHLVAKALRVDVAAKLNHETVTRDLRLIIGAELFCPGDKPIQHEE